MSIMSGQEDIAISIIRMEKLLTSVMNKIEKSYWQPDREFAKIRKCFRQPANRRARKKVAHPDNGIEKFGDSTLLRDIIDLIGSLKTSVVCRMKRSPEAERAYAINLHDCRIKVAETLAELEALREMSEEQQSNSEIFLKNIVTCINDEEEMMQSIKETSEIKIPKEIEESMQKMKIVGEEKEMQKKILRSEIDSAKHRLHDVVKSNAASEKTLFDMCAKIEQEYIALLAQYDRDIGVSHALKEQLLKDNEAIKTEINEMEAQLVVQRKVYTQFKNEQETALMKAFTEKLELFKRNRAAKVIQRTWKAYLERISLKKRRKARRK